VLYGFSGYGKTTAASKLVNMFDAIHVEAKSFWTRKTVLEEILHGMGLKPEATISKMFLQVCRELSDTGKPLIIDEMDHLVDKGAVEIIRDIHDKTDAPILLIGEERLPSKLAKWERVHGRIMVWAAAPPANIDDARELAGHYAAGIEVRDDLLHLIVDKAHGSVRRICVNLDRAKGEAIARGISSIGISEWGKGDIYTGEAPPPRRQP
jgi:DNA transposition AAA+ family ATPase